MAKLLVLWYIVFFIKQLEGEEASSGFSKEDLVSQDSPFKQFSQWFSEAEKCDGIIQANAAALATCGSSRIPSVRMVAMVKVESHGAVFYSATTGKKGTELEENSNAGALFYWEPMYRQVRIEGPVRKMTDDESTGYFRSLPRRLQISISVNEKFSSGTVIDNKDSVNKESQRLQDTYADENVSIPKPSNWGGYVIEPVRFEFFQGNSDWLDDRIVFVKQKDSTWIVQQWAP